jgi:predicted RNA-binding Zn ribbon-like protein
MYSGPLRDEPLAIELHNTLYAIGGTAHDGLVSESQEWLDGIGCRLPPGGAGAGPGAGELTALRDAVRALLHDVVDGRPHPAEALAAVNAASRRAPRSPIVVASGAGIPLAGTEWHGATRADVVIGTLAANAIELLTGPDRERLRACGAPGCVLMFLKDHPRRGWCSNACGNRARQARHYRRARGS